MSEQIFRSLRSTHDFKGLAQLEKNVRERTIFDDEIGAAFKRRAEEIARDAIAIRTGLDLAELTPAEGKIVHAVSEYLAIKIRGGSNAERTLQQLKNRGLIEAAEIAVSKSKPTQGFETLHEQELDELSYEQIIVDHPEEFSHRALWYSRRTLKLPNASDKPPARPNIPAQIRTEELLDWLEKRADGDNNLIARFENAEAAAALGMTDLSRHGRVYGNIQSRLDFACYQLGLPPLGLTAREPFENAWQQEDRAWSFPVEGMQRAAQTFRWRRQDFDRLREKTRALPGQAHIVWKGEVREREEAIRNWAEGLQAAARGGAELTPPSAKPSESGQNPKWTREEHILGLDLYVRLRSTSFPENHPDVIALSDALKVLAKLRGMSGASTFRNAAGVSMKMMNFRRMDPEYEGTGLASGNKLEVEVWERYASDWPALAADAKALLAEIAAAEPAENVSAEAYWVLVCNPEKWAIDKFLSANVSADTWGVRPSDKGRFAPGQLGLIRVGVDRRSAKALEGREPLTAGIYAVCEVESEAFEGSGASDAYWSPGSEREPGWPTIRIRYLRTYLANPLSIERMKRERPNLSALLLNGFQAASFPITRADFVAVVEMLGESPERIADNRTEDASTLDRLAQLEARFLNASPEVKSRVSKSIERGPIGYEVKRANKFRCQVCDALDQHPFSFTKKNGEPYVEAHHVMPVAKKEIGSLSASNIVTLCPNHHREVHYGDCQVTILAREFQFYVAGRHVTIPRLRLPDPIDLSQLPATTD